MLKIGAVSHPYHPIITPHTSPKEQGDYSPRKENYGASKAII
jgi:hypothetical protein